MSRCAKIDTIYKAACTKFHCIGYDKMRLCLETQYFKLIGRSVISSWVTAVGDFIRFYSVTSS